MNYLTHQLLNAEEINHIRKELEKSSKDKDWEDGKNTAGSHASKVKNNLQLKRQSEISADLAKGVSRADKGGYVTAKVYSGNAKQQAAFKKAFEKGKEDFYKTTHSKKILGVSNKTGDFNPQFKADKARLDFGGKISQGDGLTKNQRKKNLNKIMSDINAKTKGKATKIGKGQAFKKFASKQGGKAFKYLKGAAARNPLVAAAIAVGGLYYAGSQIKKALGPKTLTNKDFSSTAPIKDRSGQNVRFKYDKKAENIAKPYLTSKSLKKFKSGDYNVATKSGKPINVNQNMKQSAFEKQIQKAQKNPNNKKNQQFLKKFKNATRPT